VTCDSWDVVVVPFPFSDRPGEKRRPAVVLSRRRFNREGHTAFLMITTKVDPPWLGDRQIADRAAAGLPVACIVRLKLFTLDNRLILKRLGKLGPKDQSELRRRFHDLIA
jgi:mRNA interferase MazF